MKCLINPYGTEARRAQKAEQRVFLPTRSMYYPCIISPEQICSSRAGRRTGEREEKRARTLPGTSG